MFGKCFRLDDLGYTKTYLKKQMEELEKELVQLTSPVVLCHNDILLANIIWDDKSSRAYFIDYEYAAPNYLAYDIGNHFNEFAGKNYLNYFLYNHCLISHCFVKCP